MAKVEWKGSALLGPLPPVLVTSGTFEKPNVCTVAWCGILSTRPPKTYISLRPERLTHEMVTAGKEFVINLPTAALTRAVDRCGVKSGREEDKFQTCRLTPVAAFQVAPPLIAESPLSLECRLAAVQPLGSHDMFLADIVAVAAEEELLDAKGRLTLEKAGLLAYAHGEYFELGKRLGTFGFSVRKQKKPPGRRRKGKRGNDSFA